MMKYLMLFTGVCIAFFSCSIEKRRYFDGYYLEKGGMGPFDRLSDRGRGEMGKGGIVEWEPQNHQGVDIVIAEKKSDSQNLIVAFDNCLLAPEVELVMPSLDMIALPTPARVSEGLDSLNTGVNWRQIILDQRREAEYDFLFEKLTNSKRDPLAKFDIAKSFLTGISALFLGTVLILLSGNKGAFFKGLLPCGIILAIIGLVIVIVAAIRTGRSEVGDPRVKTHRKSVGLFKRRF